MLAAKRDLRLTEHLAKLNRYDLIMVDDLGYPRLAEDGTTKTDVEMKGVRLKGLHRIMVRGDDGE